MIPFARAGLEAGATSLAVLEIPAGLELRDAGHHRAAARLAARSRHRLPGRHRGRHRARHLGPLAARRDRCAPQRTDPPSSTSRSTPVSAATARAPRTGRPSSTRALATAERQGRADPRGLVAPRRCILADDERPRWPSSSTAVAVAEERGAVFEVLHLAASSAGIRMPEARFDLVRFGIAAYGISPVRRHLRRRTRPRTGDAPRGPRHGGPRRRQHAGANRHRLRRRCPDPGIGKASVLVNGVRRRVVDVGVDSTRHRLRQRSRPRRRHRRRLRFRRRR